MQTVFLLNYLVSVSECSCFRFFGSRKNGKLEEGKGQMQSFISKDRLMASVVLVFWLDYCNCKHDFSFIKSADKLIKVSVTCERRVNSEVQSRKPRGRKLTLVWDGTRGQGSERSTLPKATGELTGKMELGIRDQARKEEPETKRGKYTCC